MPSFSTKSRSIRLAAAAIMMAGIALSAAACNSDRASSVTDPVPTIRKEVVTPPQLATVLKRTKWLTRDTTVSITIQATGGSINIDTVGFHLNIPRNALPNNKPVTISVTAIAGDEVAYRFAPHGLVFNKAISATQELTNTTWAGNTGNTPLEAGYFADDAALNQTDGTAIINEYFPTSMTATGNRVHWGIPHFSGYVIITGRKATY